MAGRRYSGALGTRASLIGRVSFKAGLSFPPVFEGKDRWLIVRFHLLAETDCRVRRQARRVSRERGSLIAFGIISIRLTGYR